MVRSYDSQARSDDLYVEDLRGKSSKVVVLIRGNVHLSTGKKYAIQDELHILFSFDVVKVHAETLSFN